jgi:hypothetical protein
MSDTRRHIVINLPINLIFARFFVAIRMGRDTRSDNANTPHSKRIKPQPAVVTHVSWAVILWVLLGGLTLTFVALYMAKSALGINVFQNSHPLRDTLTWLGICHS